MENHACLTLNKIAIFSLILREVIPFNSISINCFVLLLEAFLYKESISSYI